MMRDAEHDRIVHSIEYRHAQELDRLARDLETAQHASQRKDRQIEQMRRNLDKAHVSWMEATTKLAEQNARDDFAIAALLNRLGAVDEVVIHAGDAKRVTRALDKAEVVVEYDELTGSTSVLLVPREYANEPWNRA